MNVYLNQKKKKKQDSTTTPLAFIFPSLNAFGKASYKRITLKCSEKGRHFIFHEVNYFVPGFILHRRQQGRPVDEV